jgi:hypothetical protein
MSNLRALIAVCGTLVVVGLSCLMQVVVPELLVWMLERPLC